MGLLDAPYKSILDLNSRDAQRMTDLGRANRERSVANAKAAHDDARLALFVETWASYSAWSSSTAQSLTNTGQPSGRSYGNGAGAGSGIAHALNYVPGTTMRITGTMRISGASNGIGVGIGSGVAGAAPASGMGDARGIYVPGALVPQQMLNGTQTALTNATVLPSNTVVRYTIVIDPTWTTVTLLAANGFTEYRTRFATSGFSPNNLVLFNSDAANLGANGRYFGPLAIMTSFTTASPRATSGGQIEGYGRTTYWTTIPVVTAGVTNNAGVWLTLPPTWDGRVPLPLVILFHGNGSTETHWADNANGAVVANALVAAGFAVLGVANGGSTWGAQQSLDAYAAAYAWVRDLIAIGPVVFYCNSMGSIEGLLSLAERRIPGVVGYIGTSPTYDLAANYANATFTATIKTAYGIAGDGSDYAAKTAGHDPALMVASAFRGMPALILAASDDTVVTAAANAVPLAAVLAPFATEILTKVDNTGGHSFDFTPFTIGTSRYDIVNFAKRCAGL